MYRVPGRRAKLTGNACRGALVAFCVAACGSDETGASGPNSGGRDGGTVESGGVSAAGENGSGGATATSGGSSAGGVHSSGSASSGGGSPAGGAASGGATASSGGATAGGAMNSGGTMTSGGSTASGGTGGTAGGSGGASNPGIVALGVRWIGRVDASNAQRVRFAWSGTGFSAQVTGSALNAEITATKRIVFRPFVDGAAQPTFIAVAGTKTYPIATNLPSGSHQVKLVRETEGNEGGIAELTKVTVDGGSLGTPSPAPARLVEVVGDSISCGYGNLGDSQSCPFTIETESFTQSYGFLASAAVNAEVSAVAISGRGVYRNYDRSTTETMPIAYDRALTSATTPLWKGREPDVIVVSLGTNDFAGDSDPGAPFDNAYEKFVQKLRTAHPKAFLLCANGPMLTGGAVLRVRGVIDTVVAAQKTAGDTRIDKVEFPAQLPSELGCDWHPNVTKHRTMSEQLADVLKSKLGW